MSAATPPTQPTSVLANLGVGGREDRLGFRVVVALLWRCVALLRAVRWHVVALALGFALLACIALPSILILYDLFWTRALEGQPLTAEGAASLGFTAAQAVDVDVLSAEVRREIARKALAGAVLLTTVALPIGLALYYYQVWILQRVNQTLRIELLDRLQTLSLRFHAENQVGDTIYRLYQDSAMVTQLIDVLFLTPLFSLTRFAFTLAVVAAFDPVLALVLAGIWPPALLLGSVFSRRLRVGFRAAREANSRLTSRIQETLSGIKVVKAYGAERREQRRFEERSRVAFDAALAARSRLAWFGIAIFWIIGVALLIVTASATLSTRHGSPLFIGAALAVVGLSAWNLGLYNGFKFLTGSGTNQARKLLTTWGRTQDIAIGLDRVFEILDLQPEVRDADDAVPCPVPRERITFRRVGFRYQPDRPALEEVDFEAEVGAITAIVGPTGSGKSTLMSLLLRLFDPDTGRIEIDGLDLRQIQLASLRSHIAIALQENVLFGTSIRENIRYAVPEASDADVRAAARISCADQFIDALPQGYDTPLGERGSRLSSGQRQRLTIARAVLKSPDLLVLDEPTASLDAETELQVLENLASWGRGRAIFLITHRLSTVRRADRIVYLERGRVLEAGTHAELMASPTGAYRRLVETESSAAERAAS
jgi:ABC-type multidrug transport system fused ATPase/permease subunit